MENLANSREHILKNSLMPEKAYLQTSVSNKGIYMRGPRDNRVKRLVTFEPSICKECNSERTRPFDIAFENLIKALQFQRIITPERNIFELIELFKNNLFDFSIAKNEMKKVHFYCLKYLV